MKKIKKFLFSATVGIASFFWIGTFIASVADIKNSGFGMFIAIEIAITIILAIPVALVALITGRLKMKKKVVQRSTATVHDTNEAFEKYRFEEDKKPEQIVQTNDYKEERQTIQQPIRKDVNTISVQHQVKSNSQSQPNKINPIEARINELLQENPALTEEEIKEIILKEEKEKILCQTLSGIKIEVRGGNYTQKSQNKEVDTTPEINLTYTKVRKLTPDFVVLDFETTGLSHFTDEIIQVAAVRYVNFEEKDKFVTFVKPSKSIPSRITEITGITDNDVQTSPTIDIVLPSLLEFINTDVIVAHNAPFDMKFLLANIHKEKIEYRKYKVIDTLSLARKYINSTKNHKLPTLKSFLRLNHLDSHEALQDCYVTAELYKYCYEESFINK